MKADTIRRGRYDGIEEAGRRHVREHAGDTARKISGLTSGLERIVEQFSRAECPLDDHAIIRQIGLMRAELDKLEREVKHDLREAA